MKFSTLSIHKRYLEHVSIWQEFTTFVNLSADVKQGKTEQKCSFTVTSQNNLEAQQLTSAKYPVSQFDQNKVVPFLSFYFLRNLTLNWVWVRIFKFGTKQISKTFNFDHQWLGRKCDLPNLWCIKYFFFHFYWLRPINWEGREDGRKCYQNGNFKKFGKIWFYI